ncbi:type IV pilus modification protein PilV [Marinicella gelatinilytica]|uniref:type IV pilus modification protein PilV n=1 Tax=Marinicella gelatinilytica TaxID=2996017 RepID=UPI002260F946|nr:type IV pilus modification protein PilV [Marinicella gelatinilytica]MCX7544584.1 type IV pilus modification protein PilV [Marinicella gelatinilytica]
MIRRHSEEGFTLLEVLIAIVVFSFGLLGIAGMMTISVRNNHNGYLRSQANFLAENMLDRMRANPAALWDGDYNGTAATGTQSCDLNSPCVFSDLAQYDMEQWARSIELALPNGVGTISCVNNNSIPATVGVPTPPAIWTASPPYRGVCTIIVTWDESNRNSDVESQTMQLVAQP